MDSDERLKLVTEVAGMLDQARHLLERTRENCEAERKGDDLSRHILKAGAIADVAAVAVSRCRTEIRLVQRELTIRGALPHPKVPQAQCRTCGGTVHEPAWRCPDPVHIAAGRVEGSERPE